VQATLRRTRAPQAVAALRSGCLTPPIQLNAAGRCNRDRYTCVVGSRPKLPTAPQDGGDCRSQSRVPDRPQIEPELGPPLLLHASHQARHDLIARGQSPRQLATGLWPCWVHQPGAPSPLHRLQRSEVGAPPASKAVGGLNEFAIGAPGRGLPGHRHPSSVAWPGLVVFVEQWPPPPLASTTATGPATKRTLQPSRTCRPSAAPPFDPEFRAQQALALLTAGAAFGLPLEGVHQGSGRCGSWACVAPGLGCGGLPSGAQTSIAASDACRAAGKRSHSPRLENEQLKRPLGIGPRRPHRP